MKEIDRLKIEFCRLKTQLRMYDTELEILRDRFHELKNENRTLRAAVHILNRVGKLSEREMAIIDKALSIPGETVAAEEKQ